MHESDCLSVFSSSEKNRQEKLILKSKEACGYEDSRLYTGVLSNTGKVQKAHKAAAVSVDLRVVSHAVTVTMKGGAKFFIVRDHLCAPSSQTLPKVTT